MTFLTNSASASRVVPGHKPHVPSPGCCVGLRRRSWRDAPCGGLGSTGGSGSIQVRRLLGRPEQRLFGPTFVHRIFPCPRLQACVPLKSPLYPALRT